MALSFQEKVDIRRHLGVPVVGVAESGTILRIGRLEYLMTHLQAEEEAVIAGRPVAVIQILGNIATTQSIIVTITMSGQAPGAPITYVPTVGDVAAYDPRLSVANNLGLALTAAGQGVVAASGQIQAGNANIPPGPILPAYSQCTVTSTQGAFTLTSSATGGLVAYTLNAGGYPSPVLSYTNFSTNSVGQVYGMINICNFLEERIYNSTDNLELDQAGASGPTGGVHFRHDEMVQREVLYIRACRRLSKMFGRWGN